MLKKAFIDSKEILAMHALTCLTFMTEDFKINIRRIRQRASQLVQYSIIDPCFCGCFTLNMIKIKLDSRSIFIGGYYSL